jgi:F-type H+-transporting ATPase subunit gamma
MAEIERLKAKIKNTRELQSIVKIMKAISTTNIREYELAIRSLDEYGKTVERGLQIVMMNKRELAALRPSNKKRGGAVIFGSEQGLCGNFNERIARYALDRMEGMRLEERRLVAVGERIIARLEEAGHPAEAHFHFSGDYLGITEVMAQVLETIEAWRLEEGVHQVILFYNKPSSSLSSAFTPHMAQLFPLDLGWLADIGERRWTSRTLPTYSMDAGRLFSSLVREHLFFSLYGAFIESLASENASRLSSMQAAERNIEAHLEELIARFRRERQDAISSELLDVLTGFEALVSR